MKIAMEDMNDGQLRTLLSFIHSAVRDAEVEEGWRESSDETLLLLRGLVSHISTEFLDEEPEFIKNSKDELNEY